MSTHDSDTDDTTTAVVDRPHSTELTISEGQTAFTPVQIAALRHIGLDGAPDEDVRIFFHECQRKGLDPFSRQIYMIPRTSYNPRTKQSEEKWTIQTGIDGFRSMGHRSARAHGERATLEAPEWLHRDGSWRPAWTREWGMPISARIVITSTERGTGETRSVAAVANFDEYAAYSKSGGLTSMWATRGAAQLAKCAEALAWRQAYPHDMSGVLTDVEMEQADNPTQRREVSGRPSRGRGHSSMFQRHEVVTGEVVEPQQQRDADETGAESDDKPAPATEAQRARLRALCDEAGLDADARRAYVDRLLGRRVTSRGKDALTLEEAYRVITETEQILTEGETTPTGEEGQQQ